MGPQRAGGIPRSELIAWIVKQAWCNGRVGGIGQSYYAMAQWLMWRLPPGLTFHLVPYDGLVDQYQLLSGIITAAFLRSTFGHQVHDACALTIFRGLW